ncbi:MAG TPA: hypothetical protein VF885_09290 [Arthrobacter sp.]
MTTVTKPTPEQTDWDKLSRYYTRNSWIAVALWMVLTFGSMAWVIITTTGPYFQMQLSGLPSNDPARHAAVGDFGRGLLSLVLILMASMALSLPIRKTIRTAFWILGNRPSDDYKRHVPKPIDMVIEQPSDDVQIAIVGDFVFRIETVAHKGRFGKVLHDYRVLNDRAKTNRTLSYSLFEGKDALYVAKYIRDTISRSLEAHTDYFKTEPAPA